MTANSGAWYRTGKVTLVNGSKSIVGTDTSWLSALIAVAVGDIFSVDSATWYEVTSISADGSLELDRNFEGGSAGPINYAIIRNTSGTVLTRIAGQIAVQFNQKQLFLDELRTWLNSVNTTENVTDSHGVSTAITTPAQMESEHSGRIAQVDTLVNGISAMTKAEFFALAEKRKTDSAGSGFSEWGKTYTTSSVYEIVNEGIWSYSSQPNRLMLGDDLDMIGNSRTPYAISNVNGVQLVIKAVNEDNDRALIKFPNAPDGTETYDTSNGNVVQHSSTTLAFASETATNKVITSRQDFVFLESWHEKISDKDVVYPLGNVQYGATSYEGIALATNGIPQGYSAFGEWDTATTGNDAIWSTLSDANKEKFIQDPENNIYSDGGELIQVRYRKRVVKGLGDNWGGLDFSTNSASSILYNSTKRVQPQGSKTSLPTGDLDTYTVAQFYRNNTSGTISTGLPYGVSVATIGNDGSTYTTSAHNGLCFAIPIALVSRRNQGGYHPVYNSNGCMTYAADANSDGLVSQRREWSAMEAGRTISNQLDCFSDKLNWNSAIPSTGVFRGYSADGAIAGGNSGRPDDKFYDAIYASDVNDLRMSSKKLPLAEIREKYKRMAIAGEVRGFESVPYLLRFDTNSYSTNPDKLNVLIGDASDVSVGDIIVIESSNNTYVTRTVDAITNDTLFFLVPFDRLANGIVAIHKAQTHKQANPTWTDIIGSPANIAATFPDGVEGQWIPVIPDGTGNYKLNRKSISSEVSAEWSNDNGASWSQTGTATNLDTTNNDIGHPSVHAANSVSLNHYETQAHFTSDVGSSGDNSKVLDLGGVWCHNDYWVPNGMILHSSLIGKIATSGGSVVHNIEPSLEYIAFDSTGVIRSGGAYIEPTHPTISLENPDNSAIKTLDYLSHDNNVAKLCYAYKEMIWDSAAADVTYYTNITMASAMNSVNTGEHYNITGGNLSGYYQCMSQFSGSSFQTHYDSGIIRLDNNGNIIKSSDGSLIGSYMTGAGFGDNNKFEITDGQESFTDDNGQTGLRGSASFNTQHFIVET